MLATAVCAGQFGAFGANVRAEEILPDASLEEIKEETQEVVQEAAKEVTPEETGGNASWREDANSDNSTEDASDEQSSGDSSFENSDNSDAAENGEEQESAAEGLDDLTDDDNAVSDGNASTTEDDGHTYTKEFYHEEEVDGFGIRIHADAGVLPDDVTVKVKHLSENEEKELQEAINDECNDGLFYSSSFDISFYDSDDIEIQPKDGEVEVSFDVSQDMVAESEGCGVSDITVMHFEDEADCAKVEAETKEKNEEHSLTEIPDSEVYYDDDGNLVQMPVLLYSEPGEKHSMSVSFAADSFSVYSLVLAAKYEFEPTESGTEQLIELTDTDALANDFDDYLQQAFTYATNHATSANRCRVRLPQNGNYTLVKPEKSLRLGSNTIFDLNGSYIKNGRCWGMIIGAKGSASSKGGFSGYENMSVVNGTLDANAFAFEDKGFVTLKFAHITGVTIENVSFPNSRGHSIEIAAAKDVKISGCKFEHYTYPGAPNDEAVNIDATHEGWISLGSDAYPELMGPYDDYCCKNVEISNCYFNDLYRAIGSHNSIVGHHHKNITIHDNIISNITNYAVGCPHYVDSRIYNNIITNCGRGIDAVVEGYAIAEADDKESSAENFNANLEISGNSITFGTASSSGYPYGIRVGGMTASGSTEIDNGTYYTTGYNIHHNLIEGFEAGIFTRYARNSDINENTTNNCMNGYDINSSSEIATFNTNIANNSWGTGILVRDYSRVLNTVDNEINNASDDEINVQEGSSAVFYLGKKYVIGVGEAFFPTLYTGTNEVTYASSERSTVKVSRAGKVKAKKKGSVIITAMQDGCSGTVNVTSKKAPKKVKVPKKKTIKKGKTYQLMPKVNSGAACSQFKFKSDNKKIAKVTSSGLVKAKKKGKCVITVTAYNGVNSTIVINVK